MHAYMHTYIHTMDALTCNDNKCSCDHHQQALNTMYSEVCDVLQRASMSYIPSKKCNTMSHYVIPGWNDYVREAHTEARHAYVTWRDFGKPRQGPVSELMKTTRLRFKYSLRQCQAMEETVRADALAKSLADKDMISFWKCVRRMNNTTVPLTTCVDGIVGTDNISNMWKEHYSGILNCVTSNANKEFVKSAINNISPGDKYVVTPANISDAIGTLKKGKSLGYDLLAAEHFIYANNILNILLALFFTASIKHGYLPAILLLSH